MRRRAFIAGLDRPGGNATGFAAFEPSLAGKWLELLSEIAPGLKRAAIMFSGDASDVAAVRGFGFYALI